MKTFNSLPFAAYLATLATAEYVSMQKGLKKAAKLVEKTVKKEFGTYQTKVVLFQDWEELAESTKEDRLHQVFTESDPLLRTGKLRDSVSFYLFDSGPGHHHH